VYSFFSLAFSFDVVLCILHIALIDLSFSSSNHVQQMLWKCHSNWKKTECSVLIISARWDDGPFLAASIQTTPQFTWNWLQVHEVAEASASAFTVQPRTTFHSTLAVTVLSITFSHNNFCAKVTQRTRISF